MRCCLAIQFNFFLFLFGGPLDIKGAARAEKQIHRLN
jgi:hypothetical protein